MSFINNRQIILACMTICSARFAPGPVLAAAVSTSRASVRPDDDELELTNRGVGESCERGMQRPVTSPSTRHENMSCNLSERGVEPGDGRILSEIFHKAISGESIEWKLFERHLDANPATSKS